VVAAMVAAEPKEIPMNKAKSKRKTVSRSDTSKISNNSAARANVRKAGKLKPATKSTNVGQPRSSSQHTNHSESKQARVIAMLRAPGGTTLEAMTHETGWQPHSVRGFLAGVVRKKLGLNLVSTATKTGRSYRIVSRVASAAA